MNTPGAQNCDALDARLDIAEAAITMVEARLGTLVTDVLLYQNTVRLVNEGLGLTCQASSDTC